MGVSVCVHACVLWVPEEARKGHQLPGFAVVQPRFLEMHSGPLNEQAVCAFDCF